jgi:hypothetical protein
VIRGSRVAVAGALLIAAFIAVVVSGPLVVRPADRVGSPAESHLSLVEDVFAPRTLTAADIGRGGPTCLEGSRLVVARGAGCTFIVPNGVHVVVFRRVAGSPGMNITLSQTVDLTQSFDSAQPGTDPRDPLRLRFAAIHDGTTVTLSGCQGPGACKLDLSR